MKKIIKDILKELDSFNVLILYLFGFTNIALFVLQILAKRGLVLPSVLCGILTLLYLYAGKNIYNSNDKNEKRYKRWILINFTITCMSILTGMIVSIDLGKATFILLVPVFIIPLVVFSVMQFPDTKKSIEAILNINIWDAESDDSFRPGDVSLGINPETNKKIRLPYNDRFLHMLILGPTGSGKTSQVILPMILQDVQNPDVGIIVLEPKGDLADQVWALGKMHDRDVLYFDPESKNCPFFNPLMGDEDDVTENLVMTFKILNPDSSTFFQDQAEQLIRQACKVLKRLYKDDATFIHMNTLITNPNNEGVNMIKQFLTLPTTSISEADENKRIAAWFLTDYYTGASGERNATKTFEHCSSVRAQILKLISNRYLKNVLNPPAKDGPEAYLIEERGLINFDDVLAKGQVLTMSSAQGKLRELGKFLGFFLILQLQSAVFRRPGTVKTRRGCMLYIDEFQTYANSGFSDMLTQGRSYRVASHLATQNRALIGMNSGSKGKSFLDLVSTNARNIVIFPGANYEDAKFYSLEFGVDIVEKINKSHSRKIGWFTDPNPSESVSVKEEKVERFSATDITYRKFGQIIYRIVKNNSVQIPGAAEIRFIPREVDNKINEYLAEYAENRFGDADDSVIEITPQQSSFISFEDDEIEDLIITSSSTPKTTTKIFNDTKEETYAEFVEDLIDDEDEDDII